jgi:acyl carrier protein phosphodiesterase
MNYLAHLYLSGTNHGVKVGNFIGDYVKGNSYKRFPPEIQTGIILHRRIDTFTDNHPVARESRDPFRLYYRRYSGVVVDIVFDHLLAANWGHFSDQSLKSFVSESHRILMSHYFSLPGVVKQFLPFLIKSRRMEHYKSYDGIHRTLRIMASHSSLPDHSDWAMEQLHINYDLLRVQFFSFFQEAKTMSGNFLREENNVRPQAI